MSQEGTRREDGNRRTGWPQKCDGLPIVTGKTVGSMSQVKAGRQVSAGNSWPLSVDIFYLFRVATPLREGMWMRREVLAFLKERNK